MVLLQRFKHCFSSNYVGSETEDNEECYSSLNCTDDIWIEILSRVPADRLLVFQRVCPHWRVLISSCGFLKFHMKRAKDVAINKRVMFVEHTKYSGGLSRKGFWLADGRLESNLVNHEGIKKQFDDIITIRIVGSCDGFLMFHILNIQPGVRSLIINPVTQKSRIVTSPNEKGNTCCIFSDRFEDDYKLLHLSPNRGPGQGTPLLRDYIYSFKKDVWTRLNSVETHHVFVARLLDPPAVVGDALHWTSYSDYRCSKMVLVFKIQTKDFFFMPYPTAINTKLYTKTNCCLSLEQDYLPSLNDDESIRLIEKDGMLCLCHTIRDNSVIDLWFLKCYDDWGSWARMFKIDLFQVGLNGSQEIHRYNIGFMIAIEIVSYNDDAILIAWPSKGLYLYNLESKKIQVIQDLQNSSLGSYTCIPLIKTLFNPER